MSHAIADVFDEIAAILPEGGDWCTIEKAHVLAALVLAERASAIVEIGVWMGGSLVPMLLAQRAIVGDRGRALAVDAWSSAASTDGQHGVHAQWWGNVDHGRAYEKFMQRLVKHEIADRCTVIRDCSRAVTTAAIRIALSTTAAHIKPIDILHIDGNHGPQAIGDVELFAPLVRAGGVLILDDIDWEGDAVRRARDAAEVLGFADLYTVDKSVVMRRLEIPR